MDVRYVPVTSHIPLGRIVGALPNGRRAGEPLSEGMSPSQGCDVKGPTASLLSVAHTKATRYQEGGEGVLNMKLSPQAVAGEGGTKVLAALIRAWCDLKIWHIQFNIVNTATLKAAQKDPEKYRNLMGIPVTRWDGGGDIIAAGHQWMNHVLACLGTTGMAVFVGTVLGSKVFSPNLAVYANEVIEQARMMARGIEVDDRFSLMREIAAAGPAGNFLSSDLTLKNFRHAYFRSTIFPRFSMENWQSQGSPRAEAYLSRFTKSLIEDLDSSDESLAMIEKGEAFITRPSLSRAG